MCCSYSVTWLEVFWNDSVKNTDNSVLDTLTLYQMDYRLAKMIRYKRDAFILAWRHICRLVTTLAMSDANPTNKKHCSKSFPKAFLIMNFFFCKLEHFCIVSYQISCQQRIQYLHTVAFFFCRFIWMEKFWMPPFSHIVMRVYLFFILSHSISLSHCVCSMITI